MPVEQKPIDLNKPLDVDAAPTLSKTQLTPDLTKAAIVLQGDKFKQTQAKLTKYILWHPIAISLYTLIVPIVFSRSLWDFIEVSDNVAEFFTLALRNKKDFVFGVISTLPVLAGIFACFGFLAFLLSDELGSVSSKFVERKHCDVIFGFDVRQFANAATGAVNKDSELVIYRDSPIAIGTVRPDSDNSTADEFKVVISGIHIRKVFAKVDFDKMLLEWAVLRSRELYSEFLAKKKSKNQSKTGQIQITVDAYSFDKHFERMLTSSGFTLLSRSSILDPFDSKLSRWQEFLHKFLGISRDTFGLTLTTENDDVELLKENDLLDTEPIDTKKKKKKN
ncbi:uncharacterized protein LODBEIA_P25600 [Lodderomyces beijingensis]|uniref:Inorganic phosphate transporter PHO86 n=1 Tax=Lodderomyces beijingensis TaxID=1775926 RepID=A0ABP0ZJM0_9ASCO